MPTAKSISVIVKVMQSTIISLLPIFPYGKGYALAMEEFDECIRKILQLGYGLFLSAMSRIRQ